MAAYGETGGGRSVAHSGDDKPDVAGVLADRLAATLVHHEPGWRLPRPSALARRYNVGPSQVEQAVRELAARHLIRQLPDGQLYRASPAEYLIPVGGVPRLGAQVDPMGSDITCRSRKVTWRRVPEDIGLALGVAGTDSICVVKCNWSVNGDPAAIVTTYLTKDAAAKVAGAADSEAPPDVLLGVAGGDGAGGRDSGAVLGQPAALHVEMQPPPSSVARGLRLRAGQPAAMVTVRFDDQAAGRPAALTVAALRPDLFRIVIDSPAGSSPISGLSNRDAFDEATVTPQSQAQPAATAGEQFPAAEARVSFL
jgi:DNA-binding GntR family transcriptional regulator